MFPTMSTLLPMVTIFVLPGFNFLILIAFFQTMSSLQFRTFAIPPSRWNTCPVRLSGASHNNQRIVEAISSG